MRNIRGSAVAVLRFDIELEALVMTSSSLIVDCAPNLDFAELDPDRFARVEVGGGDRVADEGAAEGGGEVEDEPLEVFLGALSALPKTNALIAFSISAGSFGRLYTYQ